MVDAINQQEKTQWRTPKDILSLLLLVGGDVVQKALGQLAAEPFVPVAFSFGWVAYAFSALLSAVGDHKIMPEPDYQALVVNTENGYVRNNRSWILGRIVRDIEHWIDQEPKKALEELIEKSQQIEEAKVVESNSKREPGAPSISAEKVSKAGLCVTICKAGPARSKYSLHTDLLGFLAFGTLLVQLGIAAIPCALKLQWEILAVTAVGNLIAFATGLLPQWSEEAFACRKLGDKNATKTMALTRGNGAQHLILVVGSQGAYNLEDLASSDAVPRRLTSIWFTITLVLWTAMLITVSGIESGTWYLLAIGAVGMIQNTIVAGAPRKPHSFGMPLDYETYCLKWKVMGALMQTELEFARRYAIEGVGRSLIATFFSDKIRDTEQAWWDLPLQSKQALFDQGFWEKGKNDQKVLLDQVVSQTGSG